MTEQEIDAGEMAVLSFVRKMPRADRRLVKAWRDRGYDALDAVTRSGLLVDERRHPDQAVHDPYAYRMSQLQEPPAALAEAETAEHESAHAWVALHLGCHVEDVTMRDADGNGNTRFVAPADPVDHAAILAAGEVWIGTFRSDRFPGGAHGCQADRRGILQRITDWEIREAQRRAFTALRRYGADVLTLAEQLRDERVVKLANY